MALAQIEISDSAARMGRPPMNVKPTLVRLPVGLAERIDALAGPHKRAEFIRAAVEAEIARREKR